MHHKKLTSASARSEDMDVSTTLALSTTLTLLQMEDMDEDRGCRMAEVVPVDAAQRLLSVLYPELLQHLSSPKDIFGIFFQIQVLK